jgi:hypothetical protein
MVEPFVRLRLSLPTLPRTIAVARRLGLHPHLVCGALAYLWAWAGRHARGDLVPHADADAIDAVAGLPGLAEAMRAVGWLVLADAGATFPGLREHNPEVGVSASPAAERMRRVRAKRKIASTGSPDVAPVAQQAQQSATERNAGATQAQPLSYKKEKENSRGMNSPRTPSCSEPLSAAAEQASTPIKPKLEAQSTPEPKAKTPKTDPLSSGPTILAYPVVGGEDWPLTQARIDHLAEVYPGADALAECRKALAWCLANPTRRKTPRGMPEFLRKWLDRAQNDAARRSVGPPPRASPRPSNAPGTLDRQANIEALRKEGIAV